MWMCFNEEVEIRHPMCLSITMYVVVGFICGLFQRCRRVQSEKKDCFIYLLCIFSTKYIIEKKIESLTIKNINLKINH